MLAVQCGRMVTRVVLLAAGRSFRMAPFHDKNFLKFLGKPLIQHQLEMLLQAGFRDILVIGGKHNLENLKALRKSLKKGNIEMLEQKNLDLGMAGALLTAKRVWKKESPMLLVSSNDVVEPLLFEKISTAASKTSENLEGILVAKKLDSYFPGGYLVLDRKGLVKKIVEKPGEGREPSDLVNLVCHLHFKPDILFRYLEETDSRRDDRYEQALQHWIEDGARFRVETYREFWQPIKYPWHLLSLMNQWMGQIEEVFFPRGRVGGKKAQVAKTARLIGQNIYFASGVKVMDHAIIQGPAYIGEGTIIGTGSLVRDSHIGDRCVVGYHSEIARSYVGDDCWFHTNYVGDSVIGNNVVLGAGTITGNLRLDGEPIKVMIEKTWSGKKESERIDSKLAKLGAFIGDNVRIGINTSLMPGIKIGSGSLVGAGIVISEDIPEGSFVRGETKLKIAKNNRLITARRV